MSKTIEIVVSPQGETRLQTKGFAGATCQDASRFLEQGLGSPLVEKLTPEFHQDAQTDQHTKQQN